MKRPTARGLQNGLTWAAAGIALFVEAQGSWKFFTDPEGLHYTNPVVLWPSFAVWTVAMTAEAMRTWSNRVNHGRAGLDGVILAIMAGLSGFFAASAETHLAGEGFRIAVAIVAAVLLERATAAGRKAKLAADGEQRSTILGRLRQRVEARFGLTELDVSAAQLARRYERIAWAAYRGKLSRRALRRSLALDSAGRREVRIMTAALHQAAEALTAEAVAALKPWADDESPAKLQLAEVLHLRTQEILPARTEQIWDEHSRPITARVSQPRTNGAKRVWRPAGETCELYAEAKRKHPTKTDAEIAEMLGVRLRSLQYALSKKEDSQ